MMTGQTVSYTTPSLPRPAICPKTARDQAIERLVDRSHDQVFDLAWAKWYPAYCDILSDRSWEAACEVDDGSDEAAFEKTLDQKMDQEISYEVENSFQPFYDLEQKNFITDEMIDAEVEKIEAE